MKKLILPLLGVCIILCGCKSNEKTVEEVADINNINVVESEKKLSTYIFPKSAEIVNRTFDELISEGIFSEYSKADLTLIEEKTGKIKEDKTTLYYRKGEEKYAFIDISGMTIEEVLSYIIRGNIRRFDENTSYMFVDNAVCGTIRTDITDYDIIYTTDENKILQIFTRSDKESEREYWYFIDETIEERLNR